MSRPTITQDQVSGLVAALAAGGGDLLSTLGQAEVSVTGATTLDSTAFGKMHVCSGTSADYTVGLPTAVGNARKLIGVRIDPACTKLITLDGNSTETINGLTARAFWAQEAVILMSDGANWFRVAGMDRPMRAFAYSSSPVCAHNTSTLIQLGGATYDDSPDGRIVDTVNDRLTVPRVCSGLVRVWASAPTVAQTVYGSSISIQRNGSSLDGASTSVPINANYACNIGVTTPVKVAAGDYFAAYGFFNRGGSDTTLTWVYFFFEEISQWRI